MNILMVNYEYPPLGGGGGVIHKQLAEQLSGRNSITIITSNFHGQSSHDIYENIEIFRVPVCLRTDKNAANIVSMLSFFPTSLHKGNSLLKNRHFDVVHSFFAIPSAPSGLILAKKYRIPHVLSILGGDIYDPSKKFSPHKAPLLHVTVKKILEKSHVVAALSSDIRQRAIDYYDLSRAIDIIHLGIQRPVFRKKTREGFGFGQDDILLVTIGRLVPRKSVHELIRMVSKLENQKIKLVVIGDGPEKSALKGLAQSLNVCDRVLFFGNVSDEEKFQILSIADIYISSSQHEGFGLVFLEAMACGLPIVSYDNGGQVDFLLDAKTGFLVRLGEIDVLIQCVKELSEQPQMRKHIGQYNKHHVESYYIENCAKKYEALYDRVVAKPSHTHLRQPDMIAAGFVESD